MYFRTVGDPQRRVQLHIQMKETSEGRRSSRALYFWGGWKEQQQQQQQQHPESSVSSFSPACLTRANPQVFYYCCLLREKLIKTGPSGNTEMIICGTVKGPWSTCGDYGAVRSPHRCSECTMIRTKSSDHAMKGSILAKALLDHLSCVSCYHCYNVDRPECQKSISSLYLQ